MLELTSPKHPIVKEAVLIRSSKKVRRDKGLVLIAGTKQVREAKGGKVLFFQRGTEPPRFQADETYAVTPEILKKITGVQNPEPVAALVPLPNTSTLKGKKWIIALDGITDPGNLGTLIRTALALGWEGVFLVGDTVDPYNDKALRAAKGATFCLPIREGSSQDLIAFSQEEDLTPLVADAKGAPLSSEVTGTLLILGSESHGPSEELTTAFQKISIPISGIESLNVAAAGAIFLYTLRHVR